MTVRGKSGLFLGVVVPLVAMMYGCAVDSMDVIDHPSSVSPGHQFEASMGNTMVFMSPGRYMIQAINRDSIYFAVGAPTGWSVVSVGYTLANDLKLFDHLGAFSIDTSGELDSAQAAEALIFLKSKADSYKARKTLLQPDNAILSVLKELNIDADRYGYEDDTEIEVEYDSVNQWFGFSGRLGFTMGSGTEMDTVMWIPDTSGETQIDSVGMSAIPVFFYAILKAPTQLRDDDTLFYYSKTGKMRVPDTSELDVDAGSMEYVPIKVSTVGTIARNMVKKTTSGLSILQRQNGAIAISTADKRFIGSKGAIYTMRGTLVREFTLSADGQNAQFSWDRKDRNGKAVSLNTYVVKLGSSGNVRTGTITLMK